MYKNKEVLDKIDGLSSKHERIVKELEEKSILAEEEISEFKTRLESQRMNTIIQKNRLGDNIYETSKTLKSMKEDIARLMLEPKGETGPSITDLEAVFAKKDCEKQIIVL